MPDLYARARHVDPISELIRLRSGVLHLAGAALDLVGLPIAKRRIEARRLEEGLRTLVLSDEAVAASVRPPPRRGVYVASRASIPERAALWRHFRSQGWPITSSWIDEDGEGQTGDFSELWTRIMGEVTGSAGLLFYAEETDLPLKGALIEVGAALAANIPVAAVLPGIQLEERSFRPVGSWLAHPLVQQAETVEEALHLLVPPHRRPRIAGQKSP